MRLIVGGAFQGKMNYAVSHAPQETKWMDGETCALYEQGEGENPVIYQCQGMNHFHVYLRRLMEEGRLQNETDAEEFVKNLCRQNPDVILVTNELGYGIVPMDRFERDYREMTGRICTVLAQKAEEVVRVVSGIGMILKSA